MNDGNELSLRTRRREMYRNPNHDRRVQEDGTVLRKAENDGLTPRKKTDATEDRICGQVFNSQAEMDRYLKDYHSSAYFVPFADCIFFNCNLNINRQFPDKDPRFNNCQFINCQFSGCSFTKDNVDVCFDCCKFHNRFVVSNNSNISMMDLEDCQMSATVIFTSSAGIRSLYLDGSRFNRDARLTIDPEAYKDFGYSYIFHVHNDCSLNIPDVVHKAIKYHDRTSVLNQPKKTRTEEE